MLTVFGSFVIDGGRVNGEYLASRYDLLAVDENFFDVRRLAGMDHLGGERFRQRIASHLPVTFLRGLSYGLRFAPEKISFANQPLPTRRPFNSGCNQVGEPSAMPR
jgi:hypothetical protein